jgi:hypothetical protein
MTLAAVHEWGTFTSVSGSDGEILIGMHHEEEALPDFVHRRLFKCPVGDKCGGLETVLAGVNQKLETPVLYLYGNAGAKVSVRVDFPKGIVSEWFPNCSSFGPDTFSASGQPTPARNGFMRWDIELIAEANDIPAVPLDNIWAPSRYVSSTPLRAWPWEFGPNEEDPGGWRGSEGSTEQERFIFYRGVGQFNVPFRVTASPKDVLVLSNDSAFDIPAAFVVRSAASGGGRLLAVGPIPARSKVKSVAPARGDLDPDFLDVAPSAIQAELVASGLYPDEAWAMVDTWTRSYFLHEGLRVLYVAPREWADELLPIVIEPQPLELVRTFVGRVEVITPYDEMELTERVAQLETTTETAHWLQAELGRFAEPKLRRACELMEMEQRAPFWICDYIDVFFSEEPLFTP